MVYNGLSHVGLSNTGTDDWPYVGVTAGLACNDRKTLSFTVVIKDACGVNHFTDPLEFTVAIRERECEDAQLTILADTFVNLEYWIHQGKLKWCWPDPEMEDPATP